MDEKNLISIKDSLHDFTHKNYKNVNENFVKSIKNIIITDNKKQITIEVDSNLDELRITSRIKIIEDYFSKIQDKPDYKIIVKLKYQKEQDISNNSEISIVKEKKDKSGLNPKYTFDSFIVGENSRFAYNLCLAISKQPALNPQYNPCLIYGGVGLGKTHLVEALGNEIVKNLGLKVKYIPCDKFLDDFVTAIINNKTPQYKSLFKNVDVLIIDDIYLLEGKESMQDVLFNIFNLLKESNKQLVFTCDRPIIALKLHDRLSSRLSSGITADLKAPDYETRLAIINSKCKKYNINLSKEIKEFIAKNVITNVRNIEGCLNKINSFSALLGKNIDDINTIKEILSDMIITPDEDDIITDSLIINTISEYFSIKPTDIRGKKKTKSFVKPRNYAIYLMSKLTKMSTTEIGILLGGRDHSTISYSVGKIKDELETNPETKKTIDELTEKIRRNN